jgi:hypothetical protein
VTPADDELIRLRDWRHGVVAPQLESLRLKVDMALERLDKLEPQVARMARADEIADAVTEHIRASRRGLLSTGEKVAGLAVGAVALANLIAQFVH